MKRTSAFIRTDKAIQSALIALLKKKSFEKITVQDILDETPVTRATFYKHYHDKYEIAERMLAEYEQKFASSYALLLEKDFENYPDIFREALESEGDLMRALFQIQTDRVDLREYMTDTMRDIYLKDAAGPHAQEEAMIYAQIMVAIQMIFLETDKKQELSWDYSHQLLLPVVLKIFQLDQDEETIRFLRKKLAEPSRHP